MGLKVIQHEKAIEIENNHFIESFIIPDVKQLNGYNSKDVLNTFQQSEYRSIVRKLSALSYTTRPDLCYDVKLLSHRVGNAMKEDFICARKIMSKAKSMPTMIKFADIGDKQNCVLIGHGDAGIRNMPDKITHPSRRMCCSIN